jgi:glycosyltransferase involved in cell wall biosynthesis
MPVTDLVVLSHLRWTWVWQRPQHLISRLAGGRRVWFVEEPLPCRTPRPGVLTEDYGAVTRVWIEVRSDEEYVHFNDPLAAGYTQQLLDLVGPPSDRIVWLYAPMALDMVRSLGPALLVYDVMDDLASFAKAPPGLRLRQRQALEAADIVFTGGRSLHRGVVAHRPRDTHLFPSGVEVDHYLAAREVRRGRPPGRPSAGYVGVLDERLDLDLVADLAAALPDWDLQMVGPVAKIRPSDLPRSTNLVYPGQQPYERLPEVMAGFDVALMPFALNEATRSISPTKTLEYLAAGLPVVSTRVPDVVEDFGHVVELRDDAEGFAEGCRKILDHPLDARDRKVRPLLSWHGWDRIADEMAELIGAHAKSRGALRKETA